MEPLKKVIEIHQLYTIFTKHISESITHVDIETLRVDL